MDGGDDGFKWGVQEASSFEELKQRLYKTSVLSLPDFNEVFVVEANASANGEGQLLEEPIAICGWREVFFKTTMQRRLLDPGIKSVFQDTALRARKVIVKECLRIQCV
ncbi:retrotransposon-related protein [Tanacetum coccineum]